VQAKLTVGQPGDKYEQEADRVAEEILRQPGPVAEGGPENLTRQQPLAVMRSCAPCNEELRRAPNVTATPPCLVECETPHCPGEPSCLVEDVTVAPQVFPGREAQVSPTLAQRILAQREHGQPMSKSLRQFYDRSFGYDFNQVRLHTDSQAAATADAVRARAFTVGNNIFFGPGEYAPDTTRGRKLIAHELTHTLQQRGVAESGSSGLVQRAMGDGHDLTSPRFKGDADLEAAFDNEIVIEKDDEGEAVEKLQHALIDAGCLLPSYGVDGKFGWETYHAVKKFQGQTGIGVDGEVGPDTMLQLDLRFPPEGQITLPPGDWTEDCLLQVFCRWNRPLVKQLRNTTVKRFKRLYSVIDRYDGTAWKEEEKDWGGISYWGAPEIGLLVNRGCPKAVDVIYHEIWHQNQPPSLSWCEMEWGAYRFTAQWSIYLGLPGLPGHIAYDATAKKSYVSDTGIAKTIEGYPAICGGDRVVGKTAKGCAEVEKPDGQKCIRKPIKDDAFTVSEHEELASPPEVDRTKWVCP